MSVASWRTHEAKATSPPVRMASDTKNTPPRAGAQPWRASEQFWLPTEGFFFQNFVSQAIPPYHIDWVPSPKTQIRRPPHAKPSTTIRFRPPLPVDPPIPTFHSSSIFTPSIRRIPTRWLLLPVLRCKPLIPFLRNNYPSMDVCRLGRIWEPLYTARKNLMAMLGVLVWSKGLMFNFRLY